VDGDTDVPSVQQDFAAALYQLMRQARRKEEESLHDADSPTIEELRPNGVHAVNENERAIPNGVAKQMANGMANHVGNGKNVNGIIAQGNCF